jgi:hypothetical protein
MDLVALALAAIGCQALSGWDALAVAEPKADPSDADPFARHRLRDSLRE